MPMFTPGSYWRPTLAGVKDTNESARPLLCRLGIHRPCMKERAWLVRCLRCPYFWGER
ncbi:hypothetical protein LCGC14_2072860 [marine sediment metagenome]|uniref:Uncharacterized protein n=1 Tax=marine sediment metagenome TaxID=412755 RepID=A0A0F9GW83_9ZZZZ